VCSDMNLSNESFAYSVEMKYYADDYVRELYHIQRGDISGLQTIPLYSLKENSSTDFLIEYQDENLIKMEGAIVQLQRKYISENVYEVVEAPLTSDDGTAIVHIDLNTNKYRIIILKDGEVLDTFENIVFDCNSELSGQCKQQLYGSLDPQNQQTIENINDFSYTISSTNNTISVSYTIPSGSPSSINVELEQTDQFGSTDLCNKTTISSGGSIECEYNNTIGESFLELTIRKGGEVVVLKNYRVEEDRGLEFLDNNFFIVFIFLLSIIGMAFTSPEWIILNSVITMFLAGALFLLNGMNFVIGLGSMMWLIIAAGILIIKIAKQEDK